MGIHCNALYYDLLVDLQAYLPADVTDEESAALAEYWPDITPKQFASLHLAKSFFKKFEDRSSQEADSTALRKFLACNSLCQEWSELGSPRQGWHDRVSSSIDEELIGTFRNEIYHFYYSDNGMPILDLHTIFQNGNVGPGASLLATGSDFYSKLFSSPLSVTKRSIYSFYEDNIKHIPYWARAEQQRSAQYGECNTVEGNRLSFVPKNRDTSRVICTEPNLNMFFQLGIGNTIAYWLKRQWGLDLSTQPEINKILARRGSLDDSYATVDLSSASDTVSRKMIEENLPPGLVQWLNIFRSPTVTLPDGSVRELHMLSSMGNGFTFPLQTLIFSCVVRAVYSVLGIRPSKTQLRTLVLGKQVQEERRPGNWAVFGDDIIVEKRAYKLLVRLLDLLGFSVNSSKSFSEGWFRESCGGDYFRGHPVRGIYVKSLETPASRYVAINRLNRWSAITGIPLMRTLRRLLKSVRYLPVPLAEADDAGVKIPYSELQNGVLRKLPRCPYTGAISYRFWESIPVRVKITDCEIKTSRKMKHRDYNPDGLLMTFLRGDIKSEYLTVRSVGRLRYAPQTALTHNWDREQTGGSEEPLGQGRLATAIRVNHFG